MQNTYCAALESALKDGCFAKVFLCGQRYPVARIERLVPGSREKGTRRYDKISYCESGSVIGALFGASEKFIPEGTEALESDYEFDITGIEREVGLRGYVLMVMMLPTGSVLAMVGMTNWPDCIPVKSAIGKDVQEALEVLNATLLKFDFSKCEFIRFADSQVDPVNEYYRKKMEERKQGQ